MKDDTETLANGINYLANLGGAEAVNLPASPSVGDIVYVKAPATATLQTPLQSIVRDLTQLTVKPQLFCYRCLCSSKRLESILGYITRLLSWGLGAKPFFISYHIYLRRGKC